MASSQILNLVGLFLNILGTLGLFLYGMPPKYNQGYTETISEKEFKKNYILSRIAISLIIIGFILQFLGSFNLSSAK